MPPPPSGGCSWPGDWRPPRGWSRSGPPAPARTSPTPPRSCRVPITLAGLDPALGRAADRQLLRRAPVATYGGRRFERLVELVNEQRPDVVAIVGDLVDGDVPELREEVAPLADLVSEQGVFFVTGNHEYFVDTHAWLRHLPTLGVDVLRNERVPIRRGSAVVDLAGIDDRTAARSGLPGHGADLDAALDGRDDDVPVVLLAHQPYMVAQAQAAGVDLQISGHTHGGQLWPFDYAIRLDQPAVEGLSRHGDTQLYVTAGAGYWGPPMRIGARPEVTVVELRAPSEPGRRREGSRSAALQRVERLLDELLELVLTVAVGPGEQRWPCTRTCRR